jgi:hypothetical protein
LRASYSNAEAIAKAGFSFCGLRAPTLKLQRKHSAKPGPKVLWQGFICFEPPAEADEWFIVQVPMVAQRKFQLP